MTSQLSFNFNAIPPEIADLNPLEQKLFTLILQYSLEESFVAKLAIWEEVVNTEVQLTEQQVKKVVQLVVKRLQTS